MRPITHITIHCTATPQTTTIQSIQNYWRNELKWKSPGYHYIITPKGEAVNLHPIELPSNGVAGHNAKSIHISYIGGVDKNGKALDNRTPEQKAKMLELVKKFVAMFPKAKVLGHRDFAGVTKECPSFDVREWLKEVNL